MQLSQSYEHHIFTAYQLTGFHAIGTNADFFNFTKEGFHLSAAHQFSKYLLLITTVLFIIIINFFYTGNQINFFYKIFILQ